MAIEWCITQKPQEEDKYVWQMNFLKKIQGLRI